MNPFRKILPDDRVAEIVPLTFGRARIAVSAPGNTFFYLDGW
jgi:hypothetical protein